MGISILERYAKTSKDRKSLFLLSLFDRTLLKLKTVKKKKLIGQVKMSPFESIRITTKFQSSQKGVVEFTSVINSKVSQPQDGGFSVF